MTSWNLGQLEQQWSRETRPAGGDRDHISLPRRSRSPPQRRSRSPQRRSRSRSPSRRADGLRPPLSWETRQQQRERAPFEGGRAYAAPRPPCRFFGTRAGCRKGRDCNFAHITYAPSGQQPQQPQQPQRREPTEHTDLQTFKKEVVELLGRSGYGGIPLGQLLDRHRAAYHRKTQFDFRAAYRQENQRTGSLISSLRVLLLSEVFASEVELVPWTDGPNPGEYIAQLKRSHQQEAERLRLERIEDEAWEAAMHPPQPVRHPARAPHLEPAVAPHLEPAGASLPAFRSLGSKETVPSAAHQARAHPHPSPSPSPSPSPNPNPDPSRLHSCRMTPRSQPGPAAQPSPAPSTCPGELVPRAPAITDAAFAGGQAWCGDGT